MIEKYLIAMGGILLFLWLIKTAMVGAFLQAKSGNMLVEEMRNYLLLVQN